MKKEEIRKKIDEIDEKMVKLFEERMELCEAMAMEKKAEGQPIWDVQREQEKLMQVESLVRAAQEGHVNRDLGPYIKELYEEMFTISREFQADVQERCRMLQEAAFGNREPGMKFGLVGRKLGHSFSPFIHSTIAGELGVDIDYDLYEVEEDALGRFMQETELDGFNVTIPYKRLVMKYCVKVDELAERIGAINTVVREADGWHGYNTDYAGFKYMVENSGVSVKGKKALVLGAGGASRTVQAVLADLGASEVAQLSHQDLDRLASAARSGGNAEAVGLENVAGAAIVVNATPVGMFPENGKTPIDFGMLKSVEAVYDLVYNPERTALMMAAEAAGIQTFSGMSMLIKQACAAAEIFLTQAKNNHLLDEDFDLAGVGASLDRRVDTFLGMCRDQQRNVVIVGMPGCGKSTVGRIVAEATGKKFIDSDEEIEKRTGRTIREIFDAEGEPGFRKIEQEVLADLGRMSGLVIATGGGCVTVDANYASLHQNGKIVWIQRRLEDLEIAGRPISEARPLEEIYEERKSQYERFTDVAIDGDGGEEMAFQMVMRALK